MDRLSSHLSHITQRYHFRYCLLDPVENQYPTEEVTQKLEYQVPVAFGVSIWIPKGFEDGEILTFPLKNNERLKDIYIKNSRS